MEALINKAELLIEALPYIQKLSGKSIVIKYGGNAMISDELKNTVVEDIILLKYIGINPIVVHGGGPDITEYLQKLGIKSKFYNGLRITDSNTMEVAQMVLAGKINKEIVALINQTGGKAIGLCGIDGNIIECEQYKITKDGEESDIGYVGQIKKVNPHILELLSQDEYIPIIAPIGIGPDGKSYNINADTVAGEIASSIQAEKLVFLTDVRGVKKFEDSKEVYSELSTKDIDNLIDNGVINGGMIPKVQSCVSALNQGVLSVHILDGRIPHCILLEVFTDKGIGTMIVK